MDTVLDYRPDVTIRVEGLDRLVTLAEKAASLEQYVLPAVLLLAGIIIGMRIGCAIWKKP